jgi:hypothetical protein
VARRRIEVRQGFDTLKLLSAAGLIGLALLASSGAGAYEERERAADQQLKDDVDNALSSDPTSMGRM